ncbi:ISSag8, transposase [Streptococcus pseudoporcinus]|uniref:ISSag8, transposase n=1 Tax=Streptococcus pseudoporcinus TaxID=361101 RepID=A0A4U9ZI11_9STRE|nr:ISSag8, transposase [Streptococcus pseudoporcinus]
MFHKENPDYKCNQVGFYSLDELVPEYYLLRQIEQAIDFSFIYDLVKDSYCPHNGRPSLDPVLLVSPSFNVYLAFAPCVKLLKRLKSMWLTVGFLD